MPLPIPKLPPSGPKEKGPTAVEVAKAASQGLRSGIAEALEGPGAHFAESADQQVLKFHGIYQQDDRDARSEGKAWQFMVRTRLPAGRLTAAQYLVHDALADQFGNGTLRLTTRQAIQLHGVLRGSLRPSLRALNDALVTTLATCGDVVRNVMCSPVEPVRPWQAQLEEAARTLSDAFLPRTRAYHEIWLDGESVTDAPPEEEPLYGKTYLPRKFKITIAAPGDASVDVYAHDVGLAAVVEGDQLVGFNLAVGGGMGRTHGKANTFPRLADTLAFVPTEQLVETVATVIAIQRDHGDRTDRRRARLKYLLEAWGLPRFREEMEARLGRRLDEPRPLPPWRLDLYHGWREGPAGRWALGLFVENGRIAGPLRAALRDVAQRFAPVFRLTPGQDLILSGIAAADREAVEATLAAHGVALPEALPVVRRHAMACPALPTCPLALTEAERALPGVVREVETVLDKLGVAEVPLTLRMTGCPNGCARPYLADIGLVGRNAGHYTLYVGGRPDGDRLNTPLLDLVPAAQIVPTLRPLLAAWADGRQADEGFGDYCHRVGFDALRTLAEVPA